MYCSSCGEKVQSEAQFCESCGAAVGTVSSGSADEARVTTNGGATAEAAEAQQSEVAGGLEPNVAGALSYLLGVITGLIFFLVEEDDEFVRFHAAQSMVLFGGLLVLWIALNLFTGFLGAMSGAFFALFWLFFGLFWFVLSLLTLVLWIYLMVKAYQGETPRIPIAASIADDLV